jgi:hypothetical protein
MSDLQNLPVKRSTDSRRRNLFGACLTHILHDGYTDQLYALLPTWQAQFGLSYMGLAVVRALYYGTMGGLQVPANRATSWLKPRSALHYPLLLPRSGLWQWHCPPDLRVYASDSLLPEPDQACNIHAPQIW